MKKILFLVIFILSTTIGFARLEFGAKLGYIASSISTDMENVNESLKSGGQLGVFARIGERIFIQPELLFTMKGGFIDKSSLTNNVPLNTIDIPIILGYKLNEGDAFIMSLQAGPVASLMTSKSISYTIEEVKQSSLTDMLWSIQVGVGFDILMFTLDLRYEIGLNNIYKQDSALKDYVWKSNLFSITAGMKL